HPPPRSPLFPYTTLFRSLSAQRRRAGREKGTRDFRLPGAGAVPADRLSRGQDHRGEAGGGPSGRAESAEGLPARDSHLSQSSESDRKSTRLNSSHVSISY